MPKTINEAPQGGGDRQPRFNPNHQNIGLSHQAKGPVKAFQPIVNYNISVQNITIHQGNNDGSGAESSIKVHKAEPKVTKIPNNDHQVEESDALMAKFFYSNNNNGQQSRPGSAQTGAYGVYKRDAAADVM